MLGGRRLQTEWGRDLKRKKKRVFTEFLFIWLEKTILTYAFLLFFYSVSGDFWGLLVSMFIYICFFIFCGSYWRSVWSLFHFPHWYICTHALILVECSFVFTHQFVSLLITRETGLCLNSFHSTYFCSVYQLSSLFFSFSFSPFLFLFFGVWGWCALVGASSFGNTNLGNESYDYKGLVPKQHPRVFPEDHRAFELVISLTHRRDGKGAPHGVKCSKHDERHGVSCLVRPRFVPTGFLYDQVCSKWWCRCERATGEWQWLHERTS